MLPCIYYGNPEKLTFKSNSYCRDDSFLFARPPSLTASFGEFNPPSNTMQQVQQVTRSFNILPTTLLTIPEEKSSVDITNDDQDKEIEEMEVIV